MKKVISKLNIHAKALSILSCLVVSIATFGANSMCVFIFHDVEKPKSLERLKKY